MAEFIHNTSFVPVIFTTEYRRDILKKTLVSLQVVYIVMNSTCVAKDRAK